MKPKNISVLISFTFGILILSFLIGFYVYAWVEPSSGPPWENVPSPINVGDSPQLKKGKLGIAIDGVDDKYGLTVGVGVKVTHTGSDPTLYIEDEKNDPTPFVIDASGNVGIGTKTPEAKLEVAGQVKITGGDPGAGKVLTSDASGLASWKTPRGINFVSGPSIDLTGNTDNIWDLSGTVGANKAIVFLRCWNTNGAYSPRINVRSYDDPNCGSCMGDAHYFGAGANNAELVRSGSSSLIYYLISPTDDAGRIKIYMTAGEATCQLIGYMK